MSLGPTVNSTAKDAYPSISGDGLELYFSSLRSDGLGGPDIWVTQRLTKDDPWQAPVNLGPTLNTADQDFAPDITADGLTLIFSSATPDTWSDLWATTRRTTADPWREPFTFGAVINRGRIDYADISPDGTTLFLTCWEWPGGYGTFDIWQAPIIPVVDFNGDALVDSVDLSILMDHWGLSEPLCDIAPRPFGDGIVDVQDLMVLAEYIPGIRRPQSKAMDMPRDVRLSWIGSSSADAYDVYFGTSFEDVTNANRDNPLGVLVSQGQSADTYDPAGLLEFGQTYYWRIDEVRAPPESTVYRSFVLSFTTEQFACPIETVIATSNVTSDEGAGPERTVDGSGLNSDDQHSIAAGDMWLGVPDGADPVYIQYEFDNVYKLHEMLVWNYNIQFELMMGFGLKDVAVEYSEDGTDWTVLGDVEFAQATARSDYAANTTLDFGGVAARFVRLTVNSGWGVIGRFGLSEVRFLHIPTRAREPQPEDGETNVSPETMLTWCAGRDAVLHQVYLSADREAVADGTALVDAVTETSYQPSALDPGQTYYWKITEVNEAETPSRWEGDVWEFTTVE